MKDVDVQLETEIVIVDTNTAICPELETAALVRAINEVFEQANLGQGDHLCPQVAVPAYPATHPEKPETLIRQRPLRKGHIFWAIASEKAYQWLAEQPRQEVKILLENKYAAYYIKTSDYSKEGLKTRENGQRSSINDSLSCAAAEMRQVCKAMEKEQVAQLAAQLELKVREWKAGLGAAEQSVHDHRNLEENVMLYVHYRSSQRTAGPSTDGGELMLLNISRSPVAGSQAILRICDKLVADQARLDAISPIREDAEEALMQQLEALKGSKVRLKEARQQVTTADHQAQNADMEYSRAEDQLKAARTKDAFIAALEPSSSGGKLDACEESAGGNRLTRQQVAAGAAIATARSRESEAMRQVADATASLREAQSLLQVEEAGCRAAEDTYSKTLRHVEGVREDDTMLVASMRASFNSLTETRKALRTASQDAAKKCQEAEVELAKAEARHAQTQKHLQMIKSPQRSPRKSQLTRRSRANGFETNTIKRTPRVSRH
ncbi:hypothetical protein CYMTET_19926 [Cymbomonas tetramitiformis]|uniref:Uncharacterized protein n=1 Tax=Cymbomonas tetramitiformis TaxID=36881 RepID=A0AAE0L4Q8_9CHLO|nr:hypothetical protein CYMTET_19926 [Cymbomonas tetramitiformis]